jgi:hypothetical protein
VKSSPHKFLRLAARGLRFFWLQMGILLVCLLVIEAVVDLFFAPRREPDHRQLADGYHHAAWTAEYFRKLADYSVQWHPYAYWTGKAYKSRYINVAPDGIRRTWRGDRPVQHGGGAPLRIFMFGGSTTWGEGARDDYTIASDLQRLLDAKEYRVKITNFGQIGYVSTQEALLLAEQLRNGNIPDIVIFYDGVNECETALTNGVAGETFDEPQRRREFNISNWLSAGDRHKLYREALIYFLSNTGISRIARYIVKTLAPGTYTEVRGRLVRTTIPGAEAVRGGGEGRLEDDVVRVYLANKRFVEEAGRMFGFRCLFYWQPVIYTKKKLTAYEREETQYPDLRYFPGFFRGVYGRMSQASAKNGIHDISGVFENSDEPLFIDECHITERGNLLVAGKMLPDVIAILNMMKSNQPARRGDATGAQTQPLPQVRDRKPSQPDAAGEIHNAVAATDFGAAK